MKKNTSKHIKSIVTASLMAVGSLYFVNSASGQVITGLKSFYTFDGNGNDSSGNGNHLPGAVQTVSYSSGEYVSIGGPSPASQIQAGNTTTNTLTTGFTFSLWYYNDAATNSSSMSFGRKWLSGTNISYMFNYNNGKYQIYLADGNTSGSLLREYTADVPTQGEWTYLALTYDGSDSGKLSLYIVSESSLTGITEANYTNNTGYTALNPGTGATFLAGGNIAGNLDGYAIFDRALTTTELNALFNAGRSITEIPMIPEPTGLVGFGILMLVFSRNGRRRL